MPGSPHTRNLVLALKKSFSRGVPIKVCELRQEGYDTRGNASFGPGRYLGIANANFTVLDDGDEVHVVVE